MTYFAEHTTKQLARGLLSAGGGGLECSLDISLGAERVRWCVRVVSVVISTGGFLGTHFFIRSRRFLSIRSFRYVLIVFERYEDNGETTSVLS